MNFDNRFLGRSVFQAVLAFGLMALPLIERRNVQAATIGISIPLSGDAAELGQRFRIGAKLAMEQFGSGHELYIADDGCDPDLGALAADSLETANSAIIVGMICNAPAKAIANKFAGTKIPAIVSGARSIRLIKDRDREEWNLWRLSPGDDYPVSIAADAIKDRWQTTPYAIVDDGTIYGRSFTDQLRAKMDEIGLQPQFSDTFRAAQSTQAGLLRRLQRSGVTAAFIASASMEDLFTISRNLKDFEIELEILTSEALSVLPLLEEADKIPAGIRVVMAPIPEDSGLAEILVARNIDPDRQIYHGYAAIQVAVSALELQEDNPTAAIENSAFQTVLGTVKFEPNGSSTYNPYRLFEWDGKNLVPSQPETEVQ
ncbi:MAG: ABC transporter substrate-binding protein [Pseudomonadota bacterium]